ncbi:MAG TPA: hypothetical protein VGC20_10150 [bacterium]
MDSWLNYDVLFPAVIVATVLSYGLAVLTLLYRFKARHADRRSKLFKALLEGMRHGSVQHIDDVVDLYKGIFVNDGEVVHSHLGLSTQLRQFLVELLAGTLDSRLEPATIVQWKQQVSEFIRISEERSPFEGLPPYERNILRDLNNFIDLGDHTAIKRKLNELGGILHTRMDNLNRIRNINRWSIPISMVGLMLTVLFGFVAIVK